MCYNLFMDLPNDDFILLSLINTKLRDEFYSLECLCESLDVSLDEICSRLSSLGYEYCAVRNAFVPL